MANTTDVLTRLQAALSVYDPTWDVSVGSATYKILESVAQEIAYANNNSVLQTYSYDINTKSSTELDAFCNLFGVYRQQGKRAVGTVTFYINTPATAIYDIPLGTQVAVPIGPNYTSAIYFATTAPAIIGVGEQSQTVPVIATLPGASGNVPAYSVTSKVSPLNGITSVSNGNSISGGSDPESDAELRSRWQATAFSNTTGTNAKYVLTASQNPNVTSSNAVATQQFYDEQLQISAIVSGSGISASGVTFQLIAYSGMVSVTSGTTFSGTTVVASSGFSTSASSSALASGLQAMISGVAPTSLIAVTATPSGNTISGTGLTIKLSSPSPYRLTIGSGSALNQGGVTTSGVVTISGTTYKETVQSLNPDLGVSGTMSYNTSATSGYLFPQGNELVGQSLLSYNQTTYSPITDYVYPANPTPQLNLTISNGSASPGLFIGNTVEVISEYNPACSRSVAITSGNYVDIFINGTTSSLATEQVAFDPTLTLSSGNANSYLNTAYYVLASGVTAASNTATSSDVYVPFNMQPMINFPSQLSTATSGIADTIYVYNNTTNSGTTYPIALNPYGYITFTGSIAANTYGTNFVQVNNASSFLYPGLALASGYATSGQPYYISSVSTSGVYLNNNITGTYATASSITMSGIALAYPIYDATNNQNSVLQNTGLAFSLSPIPTGWPSFPVGLGWVNYQHGYNSDVTDVESLMQQSRPLGTNTLVHQATFIPLTINVRVVFANGYNLSNIQSAVYNQISSFFANYNYLGTVSFAGLTSSILAVGGISNAKVTSVSTLSIDGTTTINTFTNDFVLASNQLPILNSIVYTVAGDSNF